MVSLSDLSGVRAKAFIRAMPALLIRASKWPAFFWSSPKRPTTAFSSLRSSVKCV